MAWRAFDAPRHPNDATDARRIASLADGGGMMEGWTVALKRSRLTST
jgi:hypothetical protein